MKTKNTDVLKTSKQSPFTTRIALGFAILAALGFSGCESTGSGSPSTGNEAGSHEMGGPRTPRMPNQIMPGRN